MNRAQELIYIIKGIKAELYVKFLDLNNDNDLKSTKYITECKSLLDALENSKNELNKLKE